MCQHHGRIMTMSNGLFYAGTYFKNDPKGFMKTYQIKHVQLDFTEHKITSQGREINIDQKAFDVLKIMIEQQGQVVPTEVFMQHVWGDKPSAIEVVPAAISRLRKLFKIAGITDELIVTVHKVGYKFVLIDQPQSAQPLSKNTQLKRLKSLLMATSIFLLMAIAYILWTLITPVNHTPAQSSPVARNNQSSSQHTQIYILRHTEKIDNSADPALSDAGIKRATYWRKVLQYIDFDAVFTTDFIRNRETAKIISQEFSVNTELYHPMSFDVIEFIAQIKGQKVLIIGHSNTIPDMANRLLGETIYPPMSHKDYNQLITITINNNGDTSSSWLHIEVPE